MTDIFLESINRFNGLNDTQKGAIVDLYRTLFEAKDAMDLSGKQKEKPKEEKKEEKTDKEEKKDEKEDEKKDDKKESSTEDGESEGEGEPFDVIRNLTPSPYMTRVNKRDVKYIAMHYTAGNSSSQGSATRTKFPPKASADFIVDDAEIYQFNPDLDHYYTWAVGATQADKDNYVKNAKIPGAASLYSSANNKNTISIEMCSNYKGKRPENVSPLDPKFSLSSATLANAAKVVAYLKSKYPNATVIRHFDVTGKPCPGPWCRDNNGIQAFQSFLSLCNSTPVPSDPNYNNVDDSMMDKNDQPPWPDFGRQFAPDKTAVANDVVQNAAEGIVGAATQSQNNPIAKILYGVLKKNSGNVADTVVNEFVNKVVNNPGMLKNVLKAVPNK